MVQSVARESHGRFLPKLDGSGSEPSSFSGRFLPVSPNWAPRISSRPPRTLSTQAFSLTPV
jgi:hypothetical protein